MKNEKIYYTMGEVADMYGINISTIRYWEKEFDILKLERNSKGNRLFTNKNIEIFRIIHHLVKDKRMTIEGAKRYIGDNKLGDIGKDAKAIEKLEGIKSLLEEVLLNFKEDKDAYQVVFEEE